MNDDPGDRSREGFDYIIVGSGAGGGPLAARLAQAGFHVLVIEAGSSKTASASNEPSPEVSLVPGLHAVSSEDDELSWRFFIRHYDDPPAGPDPKWDEAHGGIFYPRAAALGGCTIHNAMITIAGPASDWDDLAEFLDDDSWRSERMRPYFQKLERNEYIDAPRPIPRGFWRRRWDDVWFLLGRGPDYTAGRHGFGGWLHTSVLDLELGLGDKQLGAMVTAALAQAKRAGLERADTLLKSIFRGQVKQHLDPNHATTQAESPEGVILIPTSICGKKTTIHENQATPNVRRGRRSSPRELLLETRAAAPDRLVVWTDCLVTGVLFDDGAPPRAVGVELLRGAGLYRAHVVPSSEQGQEDRVFVKQGGEVVLCGGSFNTPQLLMLSGIGDPSQLAMVAGESDACCLRGRDSRPLRDQDDRLRRVSLPGVGLNLQDRYEVTLISRFRRDLSLLQGATFQLPKEGEPADRHLREWRAEGTGLYATNGGVIGILKRSRPDLDQPDLFIFGVPLPFRGYELGYSDVGKVHNQFTWVILKAHTRNNGGTVRLRSVEPKDTPIINFHYFNELSRPGEYLQDPDIVALTAGVKFVRGITSAPWRFGGLGPWTEIHPGDGEAALTKRSGRETPVPTGDDEAIKKWIAREAWGHHACGTCRMGPDGDPLAVLDSRFRVRGVAGLRVVDASIFPSIPGYFIVTNVYMASERAADVLVEDARGAGASRPEYPRALRDREAEALKLRRDEVRADAQSPTPELPGPIDGSSWSDDVAGLAISGGGVRSATFNLGVLQAMARGRCLRRIDFLSTVSGGGYIGSFLGRFYDRLRDEPVRGGGGRRPERPSPSRVEADLSAPDSPEIDWLRRQSNYLAPRGAGDARLDAATFLRNFLTVHFVVGLLLFALFGLANAVRYGVFDPATAGLGLLGIGEARMPIGHLVTALLGPFFSPWFLVFELVVLYLALPLASGYWVVSQDRHGKFQGPGMTVVFLAATLLCWLGVRDGLSFEPLMLGLALFTTFYYVERAWRRGDIREAAVGTGGSETQRFRTRNLLTYDLGLALAVAGGALAFAIVDAIGHGLQQYAARNNTYVTSFGMFFLALGALAPWVRAASQRMASAGGGGAASSVASVFKSQIKAGVLAVVLGAVPMILYAFASHAAYQGGAALKAGFAATAAAFVFSIILAHPRAVMVVNRSSIAQEYAARLARTYLGATNPARRRPGGADVTEVIPGDDVDAISDYRPYEAGGPLHLINVTVNQTIDFDSLRGNRDRKGDNVMVSPIGMSVGKSSHVAWGGRSPHVRGRVEVEPLGRREGGADPFFDVTGAPASRAEMLPLRQWIAISGAAFGPGRGQSTSLGTALLFGLANLRIGYWWDSGIDGPARLGYPNLSLLRRILYLLPRLFPTQSMLLAEWIAAFPGPWDRYWNLSDGGFFEGLGGYELVRRRVPRIIMTDALQDDQGRFEDFGEFVRKVRIDFDAHVVPFDVVELDGFVTSGHIPREVRDHLGTFDELRPSAGGAGGGLGPSLKHAALFWVNYGTIAERRRSLLLLLKASLTGDETPDVVEYRSLHPTFPNESTLNQIFDEAQWESYRRLGDHEASPLFANPGWFWAIPI